jgi:DNA-binding transcriptional LysR family regulator
MGGELDLRLLRSFLAVAEELHFGHAAQRLHITQPALSVQIRKLEAMVETHLLERTSRHVELTPAGEVLLDEARRVLASAEHAVDATREAAAGASGHLVVGFIANAAAELTTHILAQFGSSHPRAHVDLRQFDFRDPYAGLAEGSTDVAFVRLPLAGADWLEVVVLFEEPRVLCLSAHNPLARVAEVTVKMVAQQPFVANRSPGYWRDFWLAADQRGGLPVRIGAEASTIDECFEAILQDRGVAFTQLSTMRFYSRPGLAFVPVRGIPPSRAGIAIRRDGEQPLAWEFVDTAWRLALTSSLVPGATPPGPGNQPVRPTAAKA